MEIAEITVLPAPAPVTPGDLVGFITNAVPDLPTNEFRMTLEEFALAAAEIVGVPHIYTQESDEGFLVAFPDQVCAVASRLGWTARVVFMWHRQFTHEEQTELENKILRLDARLTADGSSDWDKHAAKFD